MRQVSPYNPAPGSSPLGERGGPAPSSLTWGELFQRVRSFFTPVESSSSMVDGSRARGTVDPVLAGTVLALISFGVVMVYSASAVYAHEHFGNGQHYLVRQGTFAALGLGAMAVASRVDYRWYIKWTYPVLAVAIGLAFLVVVGLGTRAGGATRWLTLGPIHVQPAEVMKLALILWLAYSLTKKREQMASFSVGILPHAMVAMLLMMLCLLQPDFGSAVMIGVLSISLLFAAGARTGYLLAGVSVLAVAAYGLIASSPYRMRRIQAFLDPFAHRFDVGYQVSESLLSFGAGGVTGVGLGDSRQKLFYLPEARNDFIGAIVGEELGFIGVLALVLAYLLMFWRGLRISFRAPDRYGAYLGFGLTLFVTVQAFTNLAVAMGMLPTKGLVLPFVSYGGSSLMVNCAALGVLLSISRYSRLAESSKGGSNPVESRRWVGGTSNRRKL